MAVEWKVLPLEDCMAAIIDYRGKTPQKTSCGIPLITAKVVKGGRIETPDEFIAEDDYEPWMRRGIPKAGDVVITTEAPLGEVAQLGTERVALAQRLIALRGKADVLDNMFLKFLMQSTEIQDQLRARASGTTVLGIQQSELRKVSLTLPPIEEQRAIAHILGTLDDKIELNRRMNETLEGIARAIFKSWFVDFDPVRAKAEGRKPGLPKEIGDLFPNRIVDSEVGEIPKGWNLFKWGELASLEYGKSLSGYENNAGPYPVYGTNGRIGSTSEPLCNHPGIVIGRKGAYRGVHFCNSPFFVIDTAFYVESKIPVEIRWAYYSLLRQDINSMDSGSAIPSTSREDFYSLQVLAPPFEIQRHFVQLLMPCWARQENNEVESRTLAALRDTLLPRLISGEIRIKDAERILSVRAKQAEKPTETIFTIGHSNHPMKTFINLLMRYGINAVADVRSSPYSKHHPQFNQDVLPAALKNVGISYVFLGKELGARPDDPYCYSKGSADFDKMAERPIFKKGIRRLLEGREKFRIALLCAEKEPLDCHRTILVCRHLRKMGVPIKHILADGSIEEHLDVERRLVRLLGLENGLFDAGLSELDRIEKAYNQQGQILAYKPNGKKENHGLAK